MDFEQQENEINQPSMPFTNNFWNWEFHFFSPRCVCVCLFSLSYLGHFVSSEEKSKIYCKTSATISAVVIVGRDQESKKINIKKKEIM